MTVRALGGTTERVLGVPILYGTSCNAISQPVQILTEKLDRFIDGRSIINGLNLVIFLNLIKILFDNKDMDHIYSVTTMFSRDPRL